MSEQGACRIWGTPAVVVHMPGGRDGDYIESSRAGGPYFISRTAGVTIEALDDNKKARLTTWLVDQRNLGKDVPEISTLALEDAKTSEPLRIAEKKQRLVQCIASLSPTIGEDISLDYNYTDKVVQLMLAWTESTKLDEIYAFLESLNRDGFLGYFSPTKTSVMLSLSVEGFESLEAIDEKTDDSVQAFIAMWFDTSLYEVCDNGFEPAIKSAGYRPMIIRKKAILGKIDEEIITEINNSKFLVADFTQNGKEARGSVYYEAGYALGRNIPVVFTCREDCIRELHFDTRQYAHIVWTTTEDLRGKLEGRIRDVFGQGPL